MIKFFFNLSYIFIGLCGIAIVIACNNSTPSAVSEEVGEFFEDSLDDSLYGDDVDSVVLKSIIVTSSDDFDLKGLMYSNHVITAQKAASEIVGRFDGRHTDTLYIESIEEEDGEYTAMRYFLCSRSGRLPKVELYGCSEMLPLLYEEGDLDGNSTDDIGYLHSNLNSQWRYYRLLTFHQGKWCYMFGETEDFLDTSAYFRCSGHEIAKPAQQKGKVCITYQVDNYGQDDDGEIKDTVVAPDITEIVFEY